MVFLLCKLFIPEYVTINIFIIGYHTLGSKSFKEEKSAIWDKILNTKYKSPKEQKIDGFSCFQAMEVVKKSMLLLHLKSPAPVKVGKPKKRKTFDDDDSFTYFEDLAVEQLGRTKGRCVLIDPRRRNNNYILCKKQLR